MGATRLVFPGGARSAGGEQGCLERLGCLHSQGRRDRNGGRKRAKSGVEQRDAVYEGCCSGRSPRRALPRRRGLAEDKGRLRPRGQGEPASGRPQGEVWPVAAPLVGASRCGTKQRATPIPVVTTLAGKTPQELYTPPFPSGTPCTSGKNYPRSSHEGLRGPMILESPPLAPREITAEGH